MLQQAGDSSRAQAIGRARTDSNGTFTLAVPPSASRSIQIAYRAFSGDGSWAATATVREGVAAGVVLNVSPRHTSSRGTITLSGRVYGAPRRGVIVALLVVYRGHWEPFRTPRTNSTGRFSVAYQFQGANGRFPFRAEVLRRAGRLPLRAGVQQARQRPHALRRQGNLGLRSWSAPPGRLGEHAGSVSELPGAAGSSGLPGRRAPAAVIPRGAAIASLLRNTSSAVVQRSTPCHAHAESEHERVNARPAHHEKFQSRHPLLPVRESAAAMLHVKRWAPRHRCECRGALDAGPTRGVVPGLLRTPRSEGCVTLERGRPPASGRPTTTSRAARRLIEAWSPSQRPGRVVSATIRWRRPSAGPARGSRSGPAAGDGSGALTSVPHR